VKAAEEMALYLDVPLDVEIELDRYVATVRDILALQPDSVIRLHRAAGESLDVRVGGVLVGSGEIVAHDTGTAVRIADIRQDGIPD